MGAETKWRKLEFSKLERFKSGEFPGQNLDRGVSTHWNPLGQVLKHQIEASLRSPLLELKTRWRGGRLHRSKKLLYKKQQKNCCYEKELRFLSPRNAKAKEEFENKKL